LVSGGRITDIERKVLEIVRRKGPVGWYVIEKMLVAANRSSQGRLRKVLDDLRDRRLIKERIDEKGRIRPSFTVEDWADR
jgi:hypothetical protein